MQQNHRFARRKKIAFADRGAYLADRRCVPEHTLRTLLSKDYAAVRRREIDLHATGTDRALYRVGAPFREDIQVSDEALIRCPYQAMSPKMKAAMRRFAPALAK